MLFHCQGGKFAFLLLLLSSAMPSRRSPRVMQVKAMKKKAKVMKVGKKEKEVKKVDNDKKMKEPEVKGDNEKTKEKKQREEEVVEKKKKCRVGSRTRSPETFRICLSRHECGYRRIGKGFYKGRRVGDPDNLLLYVLRRPTGGAEFSGQRAFTAYLVCRQDGPIDRQTVLKYGTPLYGTDDEKALHHDCVATWECNVKAEEVADVEWVSAGHFRCMHYESPTAG